MATILSFPNRHLPVPAMVIDSFERGGWRAEALRPFNDMSPDWRGTPDELEARFTLEECVFIAKRTLGRLAHWANIQEKRRRDPDWPYYRASYHRDVEDYLAREAAYLADLESRLAAVRQKALLSWTSLGENAWAVCCALSAGRVSAGEYV